jgi:hypothetical protein
MEWQMHIFVCQQIDSNVGFVPIFDHNQLHCHICRTRVASVVGKMHAEHNATKLLTEGRRGQRSKTKFT